MALSIHRRESQLLMRRRDRAHFTQVDHTFRRKAITGFASWRSAVSADVDHRVGTL
jgi:hypothetical protein